MPTLFPPSPWGLTISKRSSPNTKRPKRRLIATKPARRALINITTAVTTILIDIAPRRGKDLGIVATTKNIGTVANAKETHSALPSIYLVREGEKMWWDNQNLHRRTNG
jgi:hypothetical protein